MNPFIDEANLDKGDADKTKEYEFHETTIVLIGVLPFGTCSEKSIRPFLHT